MKTLITFVVLFSVPGPVGDVVREAFERWGQYQAFEVQEANENDEDAIQVEWAPLPSRLLGEAYSKKWGHGQNKIVLNSLADWSRREDLMLQVAMHEIGHIVMSYRHEWNDSTAILAPSTFSRVVRLSWSEQNKLVSLYGRVRPIPPKLVDAPRP